MKIAIINGPNINMLGARPPEYYGLETWDKIKEKLNKIANAEKIILDFFQSNYEGGIVDYIQHNVGNLEGAVINPAAFAYAGYSIVEALEAVELPFVEVHMSNIYKRGGWHSKSAFSEYAVGTITGFKDYSYICGVYSIINYLREREE